VRTFVERLPAAGGDALGIDNVRWNVLADSIQAAMQPSATPFMGATLPSAGCRRRTRRRCSTCRSRSGPPTAARWRRICSPAYRGDKQGAHQCNGTPPGFPAIATSPTSGFNFVQLISRNRNDMQIFSNSRY